VGGSDKIFETAPKTEGVQNYQSLFYFFFNFFLELSPTNIGARQLPFLTATGAIGSLSPVG
jgi:hypothetical protein